MKAVVVDTNVPMVANGRTEQASAKCVCACIDALEMAMQKGLVVLDDGQRILREYMRNLSLSGQPGTGDFFMKWVWTNQAVPSRCEQVHVTPKSNSSNDFEEFPVDAELNNFDPSDRVFVAVARASPRRPRVLNAVDLGWWRFKKPLRRHGVKVEFLCPDFVKANT